MKDLIEILMNLHKEDRDVIIEKLDNNIKYQILEAKGRAQGPLKSAVKQFTATTTFPAILYIFGLPIIAPLGIFRFYFGRQTESRINSFYYECKNIKNKERRLDCQTKLVEYLINITKAALSRAKDEKHTKKLNTALQQYQKALIKLKEEKQKVKLKESTLEEAETYGGLKSLLFMGGTYGLIKGSRIDRLYYHCREQKGKDRYRCYLNVIEKVRSILRVAKASAESLKEKQKIDLRIIRLNKLETKYKNKLKKYE